MGWCAFFLIPSAIMVLPVWSIMSGAENMGEFLVEGFAQMSDYFTNLL